jgi:LacI family transcriptional regulator
MLSGRVTMSDVADEAGVSKMTVSRVVNQKGEISSATRERVQQVIERLGYRPSAIARGLATRRTGTLGLVVPDIANPFFTEIARAVEDEAYAAGYHVFLCSTYEDPRREREVLDSLEEQLVDGLVLCSSRLPLDELQAVIDGFPAVVLVNRAVDGEEVGIVRVDSELGGRMATEFLLQAGHRAVGFLSGPVTSSEGRLRMRGYHQAMAAAGLRPQTGWEQACSSNVEAGLETACEVLPRHPELTALICFNDLVAVGALQACASLGRRVPDDLAIIGFDDIPMAALVTPALTTCRSAQLEIGIQAMNLLRKCIDGRARECERSVLRPELVVRASAPWPPALPDRPVSCGAG